MISNAFKIESVCEIPKDLVEQAIETFNILKENKFQDKGKSCDIKAYRTKNILQYKTTKELADKLLPYISPSLRGLVYPSTHEARRAYNDRFLEKNKLKHLRFSSLHFVEYKKGGYQLPNRNDHLEEFSCKIYLNNSKANTIKKVGLNSRIVVGSKTGRVCLFNADILTSEEKDKEGGRLILVGGLISDTFKPRILINKSKRSVLKNFLKKIYFWKD